MQFEALLLLLQFRCQCKEWCLSMALMVVSSSSPDDVMHAVVVHGCISTLAIVNMSPFSPINADGGGSGCGHGGGGYCCIVV